MQFSTRARPAAAPWLSRRGLLSGTRSLDLGDQEPGAHLALHDGSIMSSGL